MKPRKFKCCECGEFTDKFIWLPLDIFPLGGVACLPCWESFPHK